MSGAGGAGRAARDSAAVTSPMLAVPVAA